MDDNNPTPGLGKESKDNWPTLSKKQKEMSPIDLLGQDKELHSNLVKYLKDRIEYSEREMSNFYKRWRVNEIKYQAYIKLSDWEEYLNQLTEAAGPPKQVSMVVPYTMATISTIVTYLVHTYAGRKPMFQVGSNKTETARSARNMELKLQYDADHTRLIKHMFQFLLDGQQYGVGILRCNWLKEEKLRTRWQKRKIMGVETPQMEKVRETAVTYEGNDICSIDPYMFLPDPRVPMADVNRKGEFVFWRSYEGKHTLMKAQKAGRVKYVERISERQVNRYGEKYDESNRTLRSGGVEQPGQDHRDSRTNVASFIEVHQGTLEIIPAELGLGESETPEKWLFTLCNKNQVIQAQPLALDHDMHPVVVQEPYTLGYSFGHLGMSDYLGPMQDTLSWLINSHMDNVRTALNNMFVFDPSRIEAQDLKDPKPGKLIRAKRAAYGTDLSQAIKQFNVQDVTQNHVQDFQLFMRMGDALSSVTDNLRGQQQSGGRKTATEVRTAGEAAASRLAALARFISAQAITDLTEQMCLNNQQNLSDDFFIEVVGQDALKNPIKIGPEMLVGDFHYPIHDGTLPLDRVAMVDVWKEIFLGIAQDEQLRGNFDMVSMFTWIAELGGARNIEQFKIEVAPDEQVMQQAQAGNIIDRQQQRAASGAPTPGVEANPGQRIIT